MDFFELAKSRYSVRSFKDMPIEEEKLQMILMIFHNKIDKYPETGYLI